MMALLLTAFLPGFRAGSGFILAKIFRHDSTTALGGQGPYNGYAAL
jgi:hypothetical protein